MSDTRDIPVDHYSQELGTLLAKHWRDASKMLPPDYMLVLGTEAGRSTWFICYRNGVAWVRREHDRDVVSVEVTHWMPLPNLPKVVE